MSKDHREAPGSLAQPGGAPAGSRPLPNQHDWPAPLAGTVTGRGDENPSGGGSTTLIGEDSRSPVQPAEPETARAAPEYDDEDDLKEDERDDDTVPIVSQVTGGEEDEDALEEPTRNMLDPLPAARKRRRADAEDELVEGADRAAKARRLATREYKRLNVFWEEACLSEETRTTMKHLISVVRAFNVWYVRHGSRNLFTIDDAGTIRKKAAWTSRSYAEEYTEVQVPEDVLSKIQAPCSNLTYSDAAVIEMLFRDPDHLVEWNRFVTEPLDSIRHLNVWNVPNRKSMLSQTGPALYAFCEKPYVGSTEELKIRAPQHVDGIASGKGINRVVTDNYKGREFKDGPEGVVYAPPEQIERTSLYTLESKNISAYGGLVEMGGSNVNLLDRQTYREVVSREELEIGIVKTLDLLAPKNPETGTREVEKCLPATLQPNNKEVFEEWDRLREASGLPLTTGSFAQVFQGGCRKGTMVRVIRVEGVPSDLWRTRVYPPKLADPKRYGKTSKARRDKEAADRDPYGTDINIPSAARASERAVASKARLADAGPRHIASNSPHPSNSQTVATPTNADGRDQQGGAAVAEGGSATRAKTRATLLHPRYYGTSKGKKNKAGANTSAGF